MDDELADILEVCLVRLAAGASVEECLAAYPQQSAALEAPLRAAARLRALPRPPMPAPLRATLETQMLSLAAARRTAQAPTRPPRSNWRSLGPVALLAGILRSLGYRGPLSLPALRLATAGLAVLLALLLGTGALAAARAIIHVIAPEPTALPTPLPATPQPFVLDGPIEQVAQEGWVVGGASIALDSTTVITGTPIPGANAHIRGVVRADGVLLARSIVVDPLVPTSPPTIPPPTNSPVPAVAPPTITPSPYIFPTITPSPVPPPPPPAPPDDDDDDDDECKDRGKDKEKECKEKEKEKEKDKEKDKDKGNNGGGRGKDR